MAELDILRRCVFRPYQKGMGPVFSLTTYDPHTGRIGYVLKQNGRELFRGEDFGPSPCHSVDGDESIKALMSFLTLRPGDTDSEYFDNYTPAQLDYCAEHAEALRAAVDSRFGE